MPIEMTLTPEQRVLRARLAAHVLHARHDSRETTRAARTKFMQRFEDEVDPECVLPKDERQRRAAHAKSAYFTRLAYRSSIARDRKARR